jgi:hypothetical protein
MITVLLTRIAKLVQQKPLSQGCRLTRKYLMRWPVESSETKLPSRDKLMPIWLQHMPMNKLAGNELDKVKDKPKNI